MGEVWRGEISREAAPACFRHQQGVQTGDPVVFLVFRQTEKNDLVPESSRRLPIIDWHTCRGVIPERFSTVAI